MELACPLSIRVEDKPYWLDISCPSLQLARCQGCVLCIGTGVDDDKSEGYEKGELVVGQGEQYTVATAK